MSFYNTCMKYYSSCIGTEIVEYKTGIPCAKISDLIIDTDTGILKSILTNTNKVLPFVDIYKWGSRIHIKSDLFLRDLEKAEETLKILNRNISIIGNTVTDSNGTFLGYCEDFSFHEQTGAMTTIFSKKSFLEFFNVKRFQISSTEIIEIKEDAIIVKSTEIKNAVPDA